MVSYSNYDDFSERQDYGQNDLVSYSTYQDISERQDNFAIDVSIFVGFCSFFLGNLTYKYLDGK